MTAATALVSAITAGDLLVVYLLPVGVAVGTLLATSIVLYVLVRGPFEVDIKHDFLRRYEAKKALPSGAKLRLSLPYVLQLLIADNCAQATVLYRLSRFFVRHRLPMVAAALHAFSKFLTHMDISPYADIGGGVYFYHGLGTVIGKNCRIGRRATICQNVTAGGGRTEIGDDVSIWAGAKVIGNVTVGDRAEIGANAVVVRDVPPDCVAVGVPATRLIPKPPAEIGADARAQGEAASRLPEAARSNR